MTIHNLEPVGVTSSARARAALDRGDAARAARQSAPVAGGSLREKITARLGLPADADNTAVLAALDQAKAATAAATAQSIDDALYAAAFGTEG